MTEKALTVEFALPTGTSRRPKPQPGEKADRQLQDRAARKARNLSLAYWIDGLVRSGQVEDLASLARLSGVSRARVSKVLGALGTPLHEQECMIAGVRAGLDLPATTELLRACGVKPAIIPRK